MDRNNKKIELLNNDICLITTPEKEVYGYFYYDDNIEYNCVALYSKETKELINIIENISKETIKDLFIDIRLLTNKIIKPDLLPTDELLRKVEKTTEKSIEEVIEDIKKLPYNYDTFYDDIICAFGDYSYNGKTNVIVSKELSMKNVDFQVYIDDKEAPIILVKINQNQTLNAWLG